MKLFLKHYIGPEHCLNRAGMWGHLPGPEGGWRSWGFILECLAVLPDRVFMFLIPGAILVLMPRWKCVRAVESPSVEILMDTFHVGVTDTVTHLYPVVRSELCRQLMGSKARCCIRTPFSKAF